LETRFGHSRSIATSGFIPKTTVPNTPAPKYTEVPREFRIDLGQQTTGFLRSTVLTTFQVSPGGAQNLWGLAVGPPGLMKSPALSEALRPLHRLVTDAHAQYEEQMLAHHFRLAEQRRHPAASRT
jgi:uncharacterized protein DUF3987